MITALTNSIADRLNSTPRIVQGKDWKTFLLKNPWYPKRLLVAHFGIRAYDLDNWKRTHRAVKPALEDPKSNFRVAITPDDLRESLSKAWRFLFEQVLEIDFKSDAAPKEIIKLQNVSRSDWASLCSSRRFENIPGYDEWIAKGYTQIAFVVFKIYPAGTWASDAGILPAMFNQTKTKACTRTELIDLLEKIYLRFLSDLPRNSPKEDIRDAKRIFYVRAQENSFITNAMLRPYGFTDHMTPHGVKDIVLALQARYALEMGLPTDAGDNWNSSEFRKRFPERALDRCHYCDRKPVDLHHLLPRNEYPELVFESENVVPLCTLVHNAITRNGISCDCAGEFTAAASEWKSAEKGERLQTFDGAMHRLHRELY